MKLFFPFLGWPLWFLEFGFRSTALSTTLSFVEITAIYGTLDTYYPFHMQSFGNSIIVKKNKIERNKGLTLPLERTFTPQERVSDQDGLL